MAAGLLGSSLLVAPARADMIGTDEVVAEAQGKQERDRIKALVARPELAKKLQAFGVPLESAQARVDAMTDEEVRTLAGRFHVLPAAGAVSDTELLLLVLLLLVLALAI
ncbi:MAG: PA2779 family protein [Burkholderiales bacterium]